MKESTLFLRSLTPDRPLFSRDTRTLFTFNIGTKEVVYYKDYWRPHPESEKIMPEADIYQRLETAKVDHIFPFERDADVKSNVTRLGEFKEQA